MSVATTSNVSLGTVADALRELESAHCCNTRFEMVMPKTSGTSVLFWVKLVAEPRIVGRKTIRAPVAVQHRWPAVDHRTLAGLMFALAYKLDRQLDELGHVPAEQATFVWDE